MADRNSAKRKAYSVLRHHMQTRLSLDDLVQITRDLGYSVIDYSQTEKEGGYAETLISELGLVSFARNGKSFVYMNNDIKLVFLCENMSAKEKLYALAHELGHVYCGHLINGICCNEANMEEEHEANEFAHYLLHPGGLAKVSTTVCKHKVLTAITIIVLIMGIISVPIMKQIQLTNSYYGEYYVTENGEKYHISDCPIIKDKTNVHRLTVEEFESEKYEPCRICLPEGTN